MCNFLGRVVKTLSKVLLALFILSTILLVLFINFYSYSSLTRLVYSIEWLLVYTPLVGPGGGLVIPPFVSHAFHHLHALKLAAQRASTALFYGDDGFPDFDGKYHWARSELDVCRGRPGEGEMVRNQQEWDLELKCHASRSLLMPVIKTEVLNVDPPIVKYHDMIPAGMLQAFGSEIQRVRLMPSVSWVGLKEWGGF